MKDNYDHQQFLKYLPKEFEEFYQHLKGLTYYDRPDYEVNELYIDIITLYYLDLQM